MPNSFSRWRPAIKYTWAYRLFKKHHTEVNDLYWAHRTGFRGAFQACRGSALEDHPSKAFNVPAEHATRLPNTLCDWVRHYKDFDNWVRLSGIVAMTGYLEVYVKTVARLALESDPGIQFQAPHSIDGVLPLKRTAPYTFETEAKACASGEWNSRVTAYKRHFISCPLILEERIKELEFLRTTRNGVAHTFGRAGDDYDALAQALPKQQKRVGHEHFVKLLGLVDDVAAAIEKHLAGHVGDYESLYFYHNWLKTEPFGQKTNKAMRVRLVCLHGTALGSRYCDELVAHYQSI